MALVPPSKERNSLSKMVRAVNLKRSIDRADDLRRKNIIEYEARKRDGLIPLENLLEIQKRSNEQCS